MLKLKWIPEGGRHDAQVVLDADFNEILTIQPERGPATRSSAPPDSWTAFVGNTKVEGTFRSITEAKKAATEAYKKLHVDVN